MPDKLLSNDTVKLIFPAFVAVAVKIAIEMKKNNTRMSFLNICLSMLIGVGGAWLSSGLVQKHFGPEYIPVAIAVIAIMSEKIGEWLIYKFNVDIILGAFVNLALDYLTKINTKRK